MPLTDAGPPLSSGGCSDCFLVRTSKQANEPEATEMFFYGFLVAVALVIIVGLIRSPVVTQLRRGRGFDTSRFGFRVADAARGEMSRGLGIDKKESRPPETGLGRGSRY